MLKKWVPGTVATLTWLKELGIYQQLAYRYVKSNWINSIGSGAFVRNGDQVSWDGALFALQVQLKLPIYISGVTALALQGSSQYLPIGGGKPFINLYANRGIRIPLWFTKNDWNADIKIKFGLLFPKKDNFLTELKVNGNFLLITSCRELAILEYIESVSDEESFIFAYSLMEGMYDLRKDIVQKLLEECTSIKIKRVFLFIAEYLNYPWFLKINSANIFLGTGKRIVVKHGVYNTKYDITVPKSLVNKEVSVF